MDDTGVKPFEPADREACLAIFDANAAAFALWEREEFAAFLDGPSGQFWVIRGSDRTAHSCGGADLIAGGHLGVLTWTMVRPDQQHQGYGSLLTRAGMIYVASAATAERIVLETSNLAEAFFLRHGFATTRVVPDHYRPGLHRHDMALALDDAVRARLMAEQPEIAGWQGPATSTIKG